jgi:hypothetical protein
MPAPITDPEDDPALTALALGESPAEPSSLPPELAGQLDEIRRSAEALRSQLKAVAPPPRLTRRQREEILKIPEGLPWKVEPYLVSPIDDPSEDRARISSTISIGIIIILVLFIAIAFWAALSSYEEQGSQDPPPQDRALEVELEELAPPQDQ